MEERAELYLKVPASPKAGANVSLSSQRVYERRALSLPQRDTSDGAAFMMKHLSLLISFVFFGCARSGPILTDMSAVGPPDSGFAKAEHEARSCDSLEKTAEFLRGAIEAEAELAEPYAAFLEGMIFVDPDCLLGALNLLSDSELRGIARYLRAPMFHDSRLFAEILASPELDGKYQRIRELVPLKPKKGKKAATPVREPVDDWAPGQ